ERFRRPGVFARPCPLAIARQRQELAERLLDGDIDGAIRLARRVCDQAPHEPRYQLDLAGILVSAGLSEEAAEIYRTIAGNREEMSSTIRARALGQLVQLAARAGDLDRVSELLEQSSALPLPDGPKRVALTQLFAARHRGPAGAPLRAYFWAHDPRVDTDRLVLVGRAAQVIAAEPDLGLGYYLLGRLINGRGAPDEAARLLARALDLGLSNEFLRREAARLLAESSYMASAEDLTRRAAAILMEPEQPAVTRLYGADWLERLRWKRARSETTAAR
ncbi:MAG: hypothetical protein AAGC55_19615, partial [Myxococcota bacterium]